MTEPARERQTGETLKAISIAPSFTVDDIEASVRFYTDGLGFGILTRFENEGKLRRVLLKAGDGRLGLDQDDFAGGRNRVKGIGMRLWVETSQDINELGERVRAAGIRFDDGGDPNDWGGTVFTVTDPDGFKITVYNEG